MRLRSHLGWALSTCTCLQLRGGSSAPCITCGVSHEIPEVCAILLHGNRFIIKRNIQTHSLGNSIACKLQLYKKLFKGTKFKRVALLTENSRKYFKRADTVRGSEDTEGDPRSMPRSSPIAGNQRPLQSFPPHEMTSLFLLEALFYILGLPQRDIC